jgi:proteasome-associated ATPase
MAEQHRVGDFIFSRIQTYGRTGRDMTVDVGEYEHLRRLKDSYEGELKRMGTKPTYVADVLVVHANYVIIHSGSVACIERPTQFEVKPGDVVRISPETSQIVCVIPAFDMGHITRVRSVVDDEFVSVQDGEVGEKLIMKGAHKDLKTGDRVVLDRSNCLVVRKLPPAISTKSIFAGVTWDDIGGLDEAKRELIEAIEMPYKHRELYAHYGQRVTKGALLFGPPGLGKTLLGKACATSLAATHGEQHASGFIYVKGPELLNKFVGQSEENIRDVFLQARAHKEAHGYPAIVFIDEADALLGNRGAEESFGLNYMGKTIVPQFLSEMDGMEESGAFVLLATNLPTALDPAVVRDGRIDVKIRVTRPDEKACKDIFLIHFKGKPCKDAKALADVAVEEIFSERRKLAVVHTKLNQYVDVTFGHTASGAMVEGVVRRAVQLAIQRDRAAKSKKGVEPLDVKAAVQAAFEQAKGVDQSAVIAEVVDPTTIQAVKRIK